MTFSSIGESFVNDAVSWFQQHRGIYDLLSERVRSLLMELLDSESIGYSTIQARAKSIESFTRKYIKIKPSAPTDIRDLAGIRVIVYANSEIEKVSNIINATFHEVSDLLMIDKSEILGIDRVGYNAKHFVARFPETRTRLAEYKKFDGLFFEIQVTTILQHAWASISHDKYYKFTGILPIVIQRRFNLLAGTLEVVDNEFDRISQEIELYTYDVSEKTKTGELDIPINSTSLKEYVKQRFGDIVKLDPEFDDTVGILGQMGIATLRDLDQIVPHDLRDKIVAWDDVDRTYSGVIAATFLMRENVKRTSTILEKESDMGWTEEDYKKAERYGLDVHSIREYENRKKANEDVTKSKDRKSPI